ncbi:DNA alkylation repair protein [Ectobacillus polymachus]|uniref:DNA alkylation repair protein n=1 Tax=Ectobacillus polymachus TaxID=1508806 RepID=UPI003A8C56B5
MHPFVQALQLHYDPYRNTENAEYMKRYMKNQFPFLGVRAPERKELLKSFLSTRPKPLAAELPIIIRSLWGLPEREFTYIALDILEKNKKCLDSSFLPLLEEMIITNSWWDTVDYIASRLIGPIFSAHPDLIESFIHEWMHSENIWLQRTCILFQLKYKEKTNETLLFSIIEKLTDQKEFFIQKAIGWALREYAKTNEASVLQFVKTHSLAPLSKREALKHIVQIDGTL